MVAVLSEELEPAGGRRYVERVMAREGQLDIREVVALVLSLSSRTALDRRSARPRSLV